MALILRERALSRHLTWLVLLTAASGAALGLLVPLLNRLILKHPLPIGVAILYGVLLVGSYFLYHASATGIAGTFGRELAALRVQVAELLSRAELRVVETCSGVEAQLTRDIDTINKISESVVYAVQATFLFLVSSIYVMTISLYGFVIWCLAFFLIGARVRPAFLRQQALVRRMSGDESEYAAMLTQYVRGFKQLKLDGSANTAMRDEISVRSQALHQGRTELCGTTTDSIIKSTDIFSLGIGILLFWATGSSSLDDAAMFQLVTAFLFTVSPVVWLVRDAPNLLAAYEAYQRLVALAERLRGAESERAEEPAERAAFQEIRISGVEFSYGGDPESAGAPRIGPIDLTLRRGDLVFITGGNGSGKSTLMKLLSGLYAPQRGGVWLDGVPVEAGERPAYRSLFTAIFADQHLFEKPYGCAVPDPAGVAAKLAYLGLEQATAFQDGRFTKLALSTGQGKRLAMAVALLEDRPIYLLDEWTAHQDPERRAFFYATLLPELKARGKTVIAVSHDDRYFHLADRLIRMSDGKIVAEHRSSACTPDDTTNSS